MTPHDKILQTLCDNDNSSDGEMTMLQMILNSEAISDESKNRFADDILDVAFNKDKKAEKFIKQSPFLLKNNGYTSVGKYKNWFWISSEDQGFISYCGTTIQELAYSLNSDLVEIENQEELIEIITDFTEDTEESELLINNFLKICNDNGVSFDFAKIKNVKVDKNEERKFIEAVQQEFGFTPKPSYIGQVG